ncbi:MAG: transketolase [Negativicutes bacterium]|nr:transketolase [Negativicutes bacterium]
MEKLDQQAISTLRCLSIDQVEAAKSGHPGLPLGAAPMAYALWKNTMKFDPTCPDWPDRDRFILSAGHGSALIYSLLYLFGYPLTLGDLKNFRQYDSLTPGHPEYGHTVGVEVTTGPLGQGFAHGVGFAIGEAHLAARYNKPDHTLFDHYTYAIVSDGDLMEGISQEAASLAGHLGLGKMIYLYDSNHICIEGNTELSFSDDTKKRFEALNWQVLTVADGNDVDAIQQAIDEGKKESEKPTLIIVTTKIGYGSPKEDTAGAHGEPLGADGTKVTKEFFGMPTEPAFHVPAGVRTHCLQAGDQGKALRQAWDEKYQTYKEVYPELGTELATRLMDRLPADWKEALPVFKEEEGYATRETSGKVLEALANKIPAIMGGSADLAPSTKTYVKGIGDFSKATPEGRNLRFGIREHGMTAVVNGLALHGGFLPYGSTFFVFADYMRPGIRLAALMQSRSFFILTHDGIGVGEDGPTHQPIEQLASLRAMPGLTIFRPADGNETVAAWEWALENDGPVAFVLSRQKLPTLPAEVARNAVRGAYIVSKGHNPKGIIVATGAEVWVALEAQKLLAEKDISVNVVSFPSWEAFDSQSSDYQAQVFPEGLPVLSVEAGATFGWERYADDSVGIDRFGASGPAGILFEKFGFTPDHVAERMELLLNSERLIEEE